MLIIARENPGPRPLVTALTVVWDRRHKFLFFLLTFYWSNCASCPVIKGPCVRTPLMLLLLLSNTCGHCCLTEMKIKLTVAWMGGRSCSLSFPVSLSFRPVTSHSGTRQISPHFSNFSSDRKPVKPICYSTYCEKCAVVLGVICTLVSAD